MTKFKDIFLQKLHLKSLPFPSVSVRSKESGHELQVRFDSKDIIVEASYQGKADPWLGSLCELLPGLTLSEALALDTSSWDKRHQDDDSFWDFKTEVQDLVFSPSLELLRAALDIYRGREYLYEEASPLICRCFGVRESDVLSFLKNEDEASLAKLSELTRAGMGCRTCLPQLTRWLAINDPAKEKRSFKGKTHADWLLLIDELLDSFPMKKEWKMSVESVKGNLVIISYDFEAGQREQEVVGGKLQGFLASGTDPDFAFFLRRASQR